MRLKKARWQLSAVFAILAIAITYSLVRNNTPQVTTSPGESVLALPEGWIDVGGVIRPKVDVASFHYLVDEDHRPQKREGKPPERLRSEHEQVRKVCDALKDAEHPERRSSMVVPAGFDAEKFKSDKEYAEEYVSTVEPGRVFATAQPGKDVSAIRSAGDRFHRVLQGETVRLRVNAAPQAPVAFTSFRFGTFSNKLTSITVVADKDGIASADFTASSGTIDEVKILAASPMTTGQVEFTVSVRLE